MNSAKIEERTKSFQRGLDIDEVKRKRDLGQVELRKKKRSEHISKKRALAGKVAQAASDESDRCCIDESLIDPSLIVACPLLAEADQSSTDKLRALVKLIVDRHPTGLAQAIESLKKILSVVESPPLKFVNSLHIAPTLVDLMTNSAGAQLLDVTWIVTNLASGPSEIVNEFVAAGCLPVLAGLLKHESEEVADQAVWTLSNIAGDSVEKRDLVLELGVVETVMNLLAQPKVRAIAYVEHMTWFLSNLCRGQPSPPDSIVDRVLPMIQYSLRSESLEIITDSCWILCYVTEGKDESRIEKVLSLGVESMLIGLLSEGSSVQSPALRTVGNLLTGNDTQMQTLLALGLVDKLALLLVNKNREIRKESLWCLSNIAAGSPEQTTLLGHHVCMETVIQTIASPDYELQKEALWTVSNLLHVFELSLLQKLLNLHVLEALVRVLERNDATLLLVALEAISRILRAAQMFQDKTAETNEVAIMFEELGGTSQLENLQCHSNIKVYNKVVEMMSAYFGLIELSDENKSEGNSVPSGGFQFS